MGRRRGQTRPRRPFTLHTRAKGACAINKAYRALLRQIRRDGGLVGLFFPGPDGDVPLTLSFSSPEAVMDAHLAQEGKLPLLSASFFEALEGTLAAEPLRVPARLRIRFADLGAWSPADMQRIVEQNVRLRLAALCAQDRREVLAALCVGLGGCLVLLLSYVFDTLVQRHLIFDFLTICGWVVAWDAGDRLLLRRGALRARKRRLLRLLHHGVAIA